MKLLITGAAGFLGKHAVKAAMARGWDVDSFDIQNIPANRCADVRMLLRIEADCVLHLAGFASNADFAIGNKFAAVFARTKALRLQDTI